jgi:hypothetical protein
VDVGYTAYMKLMLPLESVKRMRFEVVTGVKVYVEADVICSAR